MVDVQCLLIKQNFNSYFTDSPTSQYRNKTIYTLLCNHQNKFGGIQAKWDYLEAGNGKGSCDCLGASVKRSINMAIQGLRISFSGTRTVKLILLLRSSTYHKMTTVCAIVMLETCLPHSYYARNHEGNVCCRSCKNESCCT